MKAGASWDKGQQINTWRELDTYIVRQIAKLSCFAPQAPAGHEFMAASLLKADNPQVYEALSYVTF